MSVTVYPTVQEITVTPTVQEITVTTGGSFTLTAYANVSSYATTTTLLVASGAWYDITSVALTAGTWLVTGIIEAVTTSNAIELTMRIYDPLGSVEYMGGSSCGSRNSAAVSIGVPRVIVIESAVSLYLQASSNGANGMTVQYLTPAKSVIKCTGIIAVQIG